jgi:glycyl-tRNA synthetase (class II)
VGAPVRITVGRKSLEDDSVDVRARSANADERVRIDSVVKWVQAR